MRQFQASYASCDHVFYHRAVQCMWGQLQLSTHHRWGWWVCHSSLQVPVQCHQQRINLFYIANSLYLHTFFLFFIFISDEATGKGVFQGPCEAHPVTAGAHFTGLSPLCSGHPSFLAAVIFNCYSGMINVRAASQLTRQWVLQQQIASDIILDMRLKALQIVIVI